MKKFLLTAIMLLPMIAVNAQQFAPKRPPITGIAHIGLYTDDLKNAEDLFCDYLGFGKPYYIKRAGRPDMMFIKINDRQYVEFFQDTEKRLVKYRHAAFETTDVEAMRLYLQSVGVKVPDKVNDTGFGFKAFFVQDFNGHEVEFVEYVNDGLLAKEKGKNMPDTRISELFRHIGWISPDSAKDIAFYGYILGCEEYWRGGENINQINWIKMRLPESADYLELMLFDHDLDQKELGLYNHMNLDVDDVVAAKKILDTRKLPKGCPPAEEQSKGICFFGISNCYTMDATRIELMTKIPLGGKMSESTYGTPLRYDGDMQHLLK